MKPGVSLARTDLCPKRRASAASASPTQGAVSRPSTTSTTFISGTGLKKWKPATRSGRLHAAAMAVIENDEVLDASRQSCGTIASRERNSSRLASRFSTTASMTIGQAASAESASAMTRLASPLWRSPAPMRPYSCSRASCAETASFASRAASGRLSWSSTRIPACAATCAMPRPMTPVPITARLKSDRETSRSMGWREKEAILSRFDRASPNALTFRYVFGKLRAAAGSRRFVLPGEEPHAFNGTHARAARAGPGPAGRGAGSFDRFPVAADHPHLPLAGGRLDRYPSAPFRRDRRPLLRPDDRDREQARRQRHDRPGIRRAEREARRLHAVADAHGRLSRSPHAEARLGPDPGPDLHHRRLRLHLRRSGEERIAVQILPGPARLRQGEPGQDVLLLHGNGHLAAPSHGGGVDEDRRPVPPRALQGQRRFDPGAPRRPRHGAVGFERLGTLRRRGTVQAARHFRQPAHEALAHRADRQRPRLEHGLQLALRHRRPPRDGPARGEDPARRLQESARRSRAPESARPARPGAVVPVERGLREIRPRDLPERTGADRAAGIARQIEIKNGRRKPCSTRYSWRTTDRAKANRRSWPAPRSHPSPSRRPIFSRWPECPRACSSPRASCPKSCSRKRKSAPRKY